ncbi:MAG: hypothetical protein GY757_33370 [bacterium]|nr:hypothetical protein [bacterium]
MKKVKIVLPILVLLAYCMGITACAVMPPKKNLRVIIKLNRENLKQSTLLIFNFKEPQHAQGKGLMLSELFHSAILRAKKFKVVAMNANSTWNRLAETEEERLLNALEEGKEKGFDYILVGDIKEFFFGAINKTRVRIKIRLIEVKTKTTVFLAENGKSAKSKDPNYPLNTKLAKYAKSPEAIAEKITKELVKMI